MSNKLDFSALSEDEQLDDLHRRWRSREPNPVTQMSIRMPILEYEKFRKLCKRERRTNGEMLRILVEERMAREASEKKLSK